jgi:hypothetical protein
MKRILTIILLSSHLAGCYDFDAENELPNERPSSKLSGVLYDSAIENAGVSVYLLDTDTHEKGALISTVGITDSEGLYDIDVTYPLETGFSITEASGAGAFYVEEASGSTVNLNDSHLLKAISSFESTNDQTQSTTVVSTLSTLASGYIECELQNGAAIGDAVTSGNTEFGRIFGANLLTTKPSNPTHEGFRGASKVDDSLTIGLWAAAISQWTYEESLRQGKTPHTSGFTSIDFIMSAYRDIKTDCVWNGRFTDEEDNELGVYFGTKQITRDVITREIPLALLNFLASERNITDITIDNVINNINAVAESTSPIFGISEITPLDTDGAEAVLNYTENEYVSGDITITSKITSRVGVRSFEWTVNDIVLSGDLNELTFSTLPYTEMKVCLNLVDTLYTSTSSCRNLKASNEFGVYTNLDKGVMYNKSTFDFRVQAKNIPQGISLATVDGIQAEITEDLDGELTLVFNDLNLTRGANSKKITILDTTGFEYELTFSDIHYDPWTPLIDLITPSNFTSLNVEVTDGVTESFDKFDSNTSDVQILLINNSIKSLNGVGGEPEILNSLNWPYIQFNVSDSVSLENPTTITDVQDLQVTWSLYVKNEKGDVVTLVEDTDKLYKDDLQTKLLIPFSTEYLGEDWFSNEGTLYIDINVSDLAGNSTVETVVFAIVNANPTITNIIGSSDFNSNSTIWELDVKGFGGVSSMSYSLDGNFLNNETDFRNPSLDFSGFEAGAHTVTIDVTLESGESYTWDVIVNIDNKAPTVEITSNLVSQSEVVEISGTYDDDYSGIDTLYICDKEATIKSDNTWYVSDIQKEQNVNGAVECTLSVTDKVGNNESSLITYYIDTINPLAGVTEAPKVSYYYYADLTEIVEDFDLTSSSTIPVKVSYNSASLSNSVAEFNAKTEEDKKEQLNESGNLWVKLEKFDSKELYSTNSEQSELDGVWKYYHNSSLISEGVISDGGMILPLTTEYLGDDWFKTDEYVTHKIITEITDKSGRKGTETHTFKIRFTEDDSLITISKDTSIDPTENIIFNNRSTMDDDYKNIYSYTITNNRDYPIYVKVNSDSSNTALTTAYNSQKQNKYRSVVRNQYIIKNGISISQSEFNAGDIDESLTTANISSNVINSAYSYELDLLNETHSKTTNGSYTVNYNDTPSTIYGGDVATTVSSSYFPSGSTTVKNTFPETSDWIANGYLHYLQIGASIGDVTLYYKSTTTTYNSRTGTTVDRYVENTGTLYSRTVTSYEVESGYPKNTLVDGSTYPKTNDSTAILHASEEKTGESILIPANSYVEIYKQAKSPSPYNYGDTCSYTYSVSTCTKSVKFTYSPDISIEAYLLPVTGSSAGMYTQGFEYNGASNSYTISR